MSEIRKDGGQFVGYEYKELDAVGEQAAFYLDCYESFGWVQDERTRETGLAGKGKLLLKRERRIINKVELTRLQRHFEACMDEIQALERSKTSNAAIWAMTTGLIGTAFMAGATFAATHEPPLVALTILLALPGFLGWVLPYFIYQRLCAKRAKVVTELIDQKYDEIYKICGQGSKLLR